MSEYLHWHVGMKVVCVGARGDSGRSLEWWEAWRAYWGVAFPVPGTVYSIRALRIDGSGKLRVQLAEIVNPEVDFLDAPRGEPWFFARSFRPVQPRATDISIFTAILTGAKEREPA